MPYREKEIEKLYYTIGEVAQMLNLSPSQIRYWETEFPALRPRKDRKGNRLFTKDDIAMLKMLSYLLKEKGLTIEGARNYLKNNPDEAKQKYDLIERLKGIKKLLEQIRDNLQLL
ncbi:MAG: MerR family transcriptional regulator [Chitinophagales bacterium]|nr:MerR family transcriptional regulator [Chitinophagales bacterium]MDW8274627.1 MerR family transcriptional regulator [Chitinophagales bacterium]